MKRISVLLILVSSALCWTCQTEFPIDVPLIGSLPPGMKIVPNRVKPLMEGVYTITSGQENFSDDAVVKWSGKNMSIFTRGSYLTFETGVTYDTDSLDSAIYFRGYWRVPTSDAFGLADMVVRGEDGGASLIKGIMPSAITIKGKFGAGGNPVTSNLVLTYARPFSATVTSKKFRIVGHRGGGRTSDRLPISENSIPMVGYAGRFGATGIEIDIRLTKDGVPVVYHDNDLNIRLTQKSPLNGPIENFTWDQLRTFVRLIRGEQIPRLEELLFYTIDKTEIEFVWLDVKDPAVVAAIRPIQEAALLYANSKGRNIEILMGVPADDVLAALKAQSGYTTIPTLCEISPEEAETINSRAWGPRWTLGTQNELVASVQAQGRIAICWTIDSPAYIQQFIRDGIFDGLLTNYPSYVAYYWYIQE